MKEHQSPENELFLSLTANYVLQDAFFLIFVGIFLSVLFHCVDLLAHTKIHLL